MHDLIVLNFMVKLIRTFCTLVTKYGKIITLNHFLNDFEIIYVYFHEERHIDYRGIIFMQVLTSMQMCYTLIKK